MHIFIEALDYILWSIIIYGSNIPTIMVDGIITPKSEKDWSDLDKKMIQLNTKVVNIFYCSLDINKFNKISTYVSAKEI